MPTARKQNKWALLALAAILAVGLLGMVYYTAQKQGYHVDELYTYELANYPGGFYALQDGYMDAWHDGDFYAAALHPAAGERFDYSIPWNNQKIDVHPPLYYCAVFTVACLFPNLPAPWVGLLPNYLFLLAAAVFFYLAAKRLTGQELPALVGTAAWLWSVAVQGMAVFTRMYSLMMLAGLALLYCHLVLWQALHSAPGKRPPLGVWVGLFAATLAGVLTQYYFLVYCFYLCGLFGLWLLGSRRFKLAAGYAAVEFGALGAAYKAFPTMKEHIFSGARGQEAFDSFWNLYALADWAASARRVLLLLAGQMGGFWVWAALLAVAAVILWRKGVRPGTNGWFALGLVAVVLCYWLTIDRVDQFEADRYYAVLLAPAVLAAGVLLARLAALVPWGRRLLPLALLPVLAAHLTVGVAYLYPEYADRRAALAATQTLPAIVVNDAGYEVAPDLFVMEFAQREAVYQCGETTAAALQNAAATRDLTGGFVLYGYTSDADALLALAQQALPVQSATLLTEVGHCPVYLIELAEEAG